MIARMGRTRFIMCALLILVLCAAVIFAAFGIKLPEASGKTVKKDGKMTIDCSNMSEGYIMVKAKKSSKKLKVQIATAGAKLNYNLNGNGEYEVFPLQFGSGKYQIKLYEHVKGKSYSEEGKVKLSVKMPDELEKHVKSFGFMIGQTRVNTVYAAAVTFRNTLYWDITSVVQEDRIETVLEETLRECGVPYVRCPARTNREEDTPEE